MENRTSKITVVFEKQRKELPTTIKSFKQLITCIVETFPGEGFPLAFKLEYADEENDRIMLINEDDYKLFNDMADKTVYLIP